MKIENVLYTDGREVTVTDSVLKVRRKWYSLNDISKHSFRILRPNRLPCIALVVTGILLAGGSESSFLESIPSIVVFGLTIKAHYFLLAIGILVVLLGSTWIGSLAERYAVTITTREGDKNVVVSRRKEYITQIVHALNEAFFASHYAKSEEVKRKFIVSGR